MVIVLRRGAEPRAGGLERRLPSTARPGGRPAPQTSALPPVAADQLHEATAAKVVLVHAFIRPPDAHQLLRVVAADRQDHAPEHAELTQRQARDLADGSGQ